MVDVPRLSWFYWDRTEQDWVAVVSFLDQNGYLICETDHFSTWTTAKLESVAAIPFEYLTVRGCNQKE